MGRAGRDLYGENKEPEMKEETFHNSPKGEMIGVTGKGWLGKMFSRVSTLSRIRIQEA
jgi:hypothetical protein